VHLPVKPVQEIENSKMTELVSVHQENSKLVKNSVKTVMSNVQNVLEQLPIVDLVPETELTNQYVTVQKELIILVKQLAQIVLISVTNVHLMMFVILVQQDMDHHQNVHLSQFHRVLKSEMFQ
jgi:hypothetical protein